MICFDFEKTVNSLPKDRVEEARKLAEKVKPVVMKEGLLYDLMRDCIDNSHDGAEYMRLKERATQIQKEDSVFIILAESTVGMALRAVLDPLGNGRPQMMFLGDSLSANSLFAVMNHLRNRSVYLYVIADDLKKPQIGAHFRVLRQWLENAYGRVDSAQRIIVASPEGSDLHELALEQEYLYQSYDRSFAKELIAFHPVAYLPLVVASIDLKEFFNGARSTIAELESETAGPLMDYVAIRWLAYQLGIEVESVCTFEPTLESFCSWRARLVGNDMIYHGYNLFLRDLDNLKHYHARYMNKMMETFINVTVPTIDIVVRPDPNFKDGLEQLDNISFNELNNIACDEIIHEHREKGIYVNEVQCRRLSAVNMGSLLFFFIAAGVLVLKMIEEGGVK